MKATELRIGNRVIYKPYGNKEGAEVIICGLLDMRAYFNKFSNDSGMLHYIQGIPITPEILEAYGFKKDMGGGGGILEFEKGHICFYNMDVPTVGITSHMTQGAEMPNLKYVHQLQNLYFAIAGKELNIIT